MNIKELKKIIADLPDEMDVFIAERKTEFAYGLANSAKVKTIPFAEDLLGEPMAYDEVLILDEE